MELNETTRQNLINRLKRIEGQTRGVQTMLQDNRDCQEIVQQLTAIRSALAGASAALMKEYVNECLSNPEIEPIKRQQLVDHLINLLGKT